jgi:hypothetical protein
MIRSALRARQQGRRRRRLPRVLAGLAGFLAMLGGDLCLQALTPVYGWASISVEAPFAPRDGAGLLVYQNKLWLLGGWNPDPAVFPKTTTNEVWNSPDGKHWAQVKHNTFGTSAFNPATDWEGRHMAGWAVFQNKLWIIGGDSNQCHYQPNVWNSSDGVHWTEVASNVPWGNRVLFYTVVFNNRLFVIGGQTLDLDYCPGLGENESVYNDVWSSSDGANWTQVKLYTGQGTSGTASALRQWPQNTVGTMPALGQLPQRTAGLSEWSPRGVICGAVVFNGQMWLIGGGVYGTPSTPGALYNDVWNSTDGVTWTRVTYHAPWNPRIYHDITVFDGHMWVIGGHGPDSSSNLADVWYSIDGVHWTQLANTPWPGRHAASVAVFKNALWLTGGSTDDSPQNDVWRLINNGAIVPLIDSQLLQ